MDTHETEIAEIRMFNRFYTHYLGLLDHRLLDSPFTLVQGRVLYELGVQRAPSAAGVSAMLGLDPASVSRLLARFEADGFILRKPSESDGRCKTITLTESGRAAFEQLDAAANGQLRAILDDLTPLARRQLAESLARAMQILGRPGEMRAVVRSHEPGDIGWVIESHGRLYHEEYRWNSDFEVLVAEIAGGFLREHDPEREHCWIAVAEGERVGCVFVVADPDDPTVARLRLLLVEPHARGMGLGTELIYLCIEFARSVGYRRLALWTNDVLVDARVLYERAGFALAKETPHHSFGQDLVAQDWILEL